MTTYSVMKYIRNESVVSLHHKEFHATPQDVYPSTTVCFSNTNKTEVTRLMTKLEEFEKNLNVTYNNITMNMEDFSTSIYYRVHQKELLNKLG